ncbi:MAG: coenzyme A pyrophosphatase [Planctomycetota bacterium]|nr:MAG: coenzyme A pyrophosphatase [Planctomycetota bacterium]
MFGERLTIARIERALRARPPGEGAAGLLARLPGVRRAAVAVVLREPPGGEAEVLLIRRTERPGDPWAGQIALPGGRLEPADGGSARAAAVREVREEVGLDLGAGGRWLGRLAPAQAMARGRPLPLVIFPQVFGLGEPLLPLAPHPAEVARVLWVPLGALASGEHDDTIRWRPAGLPAGLDLRCWRWQGEVIWGLTYRMLRSLLALL